MLATPGRITHAHVFRALALALAGGVGALHFPAAAVAMDTAPALVALLPTAGLATAAQLAYARTDSVVRATGILPVAAARAVDPSHEAAATGTFDPSDEAAATDSVGAAAATDSVNAAMIRSRFVAVPLLPLVDPAAIETADAGASDDAEFGASAQVAPIPPGMSFDPLGLVVQSGAASWYGDEFSGRMTASGEAYDPAALTVAHQSFPLGSMIEICNLDNGRRTLARVNDRGPFVENRILDCSLGVAQALQFVGHGVARVDITLLDPNANVPAIFARRSQPLVEDASPPIPSAHAVADRLAFVSAPKAARRADLTRPGAFGDPGRGDMVLRRASVLPFPALVHASHWLWNALVGPRDDESAARETRQLLEATGIRGFIHLFTH